MKALFALCVLLTVPTGGSPAFAQSQNCAPFDVVASRLSEVYSEQPRVRTLLSNGSLFMLWASPQGETWTTTVTLPSGVTCLAASGENMEFLPVQGVEGDPT